MRAKMPRGLRVWGLLPAMLAWVAGCAQSLERHYLGDADLVYYKNSATAIEYPNVDAPVEARALGSQKPPTVRDPSDQPPWDLTLAEAVQIAISSSKTIRSRGAFKSPANPLMTNPDRIASGYDAAIQETNTGFYQRGPEAALSAFDAQLKLAARLGRSEMLQNNALLSGGILGGGQLTSNNAVMQASVSKIFANGSQFELSHDWSYLGTNQPFQLFPSYYRPTARADFRQPLLAGAGTEFMAIGGPYSQIIPGVIVTDQGVLIARINTDITLADFELNVTNLVKDVEDQYWELYLAYRTKDAEEAAQKSAHNFWQMTKRRVDAGALKGSAIDEGQARENYFTARARLENAVSALYAAESQLRRLLGLPVNDGKFLRPIDDPISAELHSDWTLALTESLSRRVELRQQKWRIKSLELQLRAAESLVQPKLDFVGGYQVNGFGDNLFGHNNPSGTREEQFQSAYDTLTDAHQTGWDVGLQFSLPIGLRQALAHQRNLELRVMKARAVLADQELEISHELGHTFGLIDNWYQQVETNFDRMISARQQLEIVERSYENERISVDLLLRSQSNLAVAETAYYTALARYNQAIADLRLRKGTLLEDNHIYLAEGDWVPDAQQEAIRRAWARSFGKPAEQLEEHTEPLVVPGTQPAGYFVPATQPALSPTPPIPPSPPSP
jgi:outer membrane protein TolC